MNNRILTFGISETTTKSWNNILCINKPVEATLTRDQLDGFTREHQHSFGPVQRWNAQTVLVRCPFCSNIHTHGFGGSYKSVSRHPHCWTNSSVSLPDYRFAYPLSETEGTVRYEIDKSNGYFVALGAEAEGSELNSLESTLDQLSLSVKKAPVSRNWSEAAEMITIGLEDKMFRRLHMVFGGENTFTLKRLDYVQSRMILYGDTDYVAAYIHTSPEAQLFLHGVNTDGNSALVLAACERFPLMVKFLLEHGANVDHQNNAGRSSLMEAALWGRIENVEHLLKYGAKKELRDNDGRQAVELAGETLRNDEERYRRSGGDVQVYREVTFIANQARRVISHFLKSSEEAPTAPVFLHDQTFRSYVFKHTGTDRRTVELIAPIATFHIQHQDKTIACLQRSPGFPPISTVSGWGTEETGITVSGRDWTDEVLNISAIVGHQLRPDHRMDQGRNGRYHACHAEKQLVAYFISKHVLIKGTDNELLQEAAPPVRLTQATVLVSRAVCDDCSRFIATVNKSLRLRITILDRSEG